MCAGLGACVCPSFVWRVHPRGPYSSRSWVLPPWTRLQLGLLQSDAVGVTTGASEGGGARGHCRNPKAARPFTLPRPSSQEMASAVPVSSQPPQIHAVTPNPRSHPISTQSPQIYTVTPTSTQSPQIHSHPKIHTVTPNPCSHPTSTQRPPHPRSRPKIHTATPHPRSPPASPRWRPPWGPACALGGLRAGPLGDGKAALVWGSRDERWTCREEPRVRLPSPGSVAVTGVGIRPA